MATILLVGILVAHVPTLSDLVTDGVVYQDQGITDLGRDLLGAKVVDKGGMPYRQIGQLLADHQSPDLPLSASPRPSGWVIHPPLALAGARGLADLGGADAEMAARRIGAGAVVVLAAAIAAMLWRPRRSWVLAAVLVMLVWTPTFTDTVWIQNNALAGLGLLAVVALDDIGRRPAALVVLGFLSAWKPWLTVFALALPRSTSTLRDVAGVVGTAVLVTFAALPFVGGLDSLVAWTTQALPGNIVEARATPPNLSWTKPLPSAIASGLYLLAAASIPFVKKKLPPNCHLLLPTLVATTVAPFVWDHYWLAIAPVVWFTFVRCEADLRAPIGAWAALAVVPVALTVVGASGLESRLLPMALSGVAILFAILIAAKPAPIAVSMSL